jgi:hypothetical protein
VAVPTKRAPRLLRLLAALGLFLGCLGALSSIGSFASLLTPREEYLEARRQQAKEMMPDADEQMLRIVDQAAQVGYDRRGATLALSAIGAILSFLLFGGCGRSLRLDPWGRSAWSWAAGAGLPYLLLQTLQLLLTVRELDPMPVLAAAVRLQLGLILVLSFYCAGTLAYLRRPSVRALFSERAGSDPSAK